MSIEVQKLSKSFGNFKAIDDISLQFPAGKLTALLGPSGSGKTTLLRLIAGLEVADTGGGAILFNGADVSKTDVRERQVGFVFQHYALFRHLTVFENIAFGLKVKNRAERPSKGEIRATVDELLSLVQLENLSNRLPTQLSGGQRQRVALARALAIKPKVLLLDEPFGALDAKVRAELRKWLRSLHEKLNFTSIFVTHDQEEALEISDRIVVLNKGKVEQEGTPDEVFHNPANEFVMHFLGEVNVFHGRSKNTDLASVEKLKLLVRPHDFDIMLKRPVEFRDSFSAVLKKTQTAGAFVKLEFLDENGQLILVHLAHDRFREILPETGNSYYLLPKQKRVYSGGQAWDGDYVI